MSTPEESFEIAADDSRPAETRMQAIDDLQAANDCDRLATLVRRDELDRQYREEALTKLAHPQCKQTLETLADSDAVPGELREQATDLLEETADDAGAGP